MPVAAQMLRSTPLFAQLSDDELALVAQSACVRSARAGEIIAWADEPCDALFVLQTGNVRILRMGADGREQVLNIARPGDVFGGAPVFCGCRLPSTCQAQDDAVLIVVPGADLVRLVEAHPGIAVRIMGLCCARMRRLTNLAAELSTRTIVRRLAWLLLDACPCAHRDGEGSDFSLTEEDMAMRLGATQESVSRAVVQLRERGIVQTSRQHITVLDPQGLRRVATGLEPGL